MKKPLLLLLTVTLLLGACGGKDDPPSSNTPAPKARDGVYYSQYGTMTFNGDGRSVTLRVNGLPEGEGSYVYLFHNEEWRYDQAEKFRLMIGDQSYQFFVTPGENTEDVVAFEVSQGGDVIRFTKADFTPTHIVTVTVRDYGTMTLELYGKIAPVTVENFVTLARSGFYDGLTFHRIMDGFMIQGGDPAGNGTGGSNTRIKGEFYANGVSNPIEHTLGTISMARESGNMNSARSQFFIMVADSPLLDGQYAAFGRVTSGIEVALQIAKDARPTDNNGTIPRDQQPVIEKITVEDAK